MSEALPDGWVWATLEDLLAAEPRAITDGPFGSNLKSSHYTDSGARVLRLQNVGDGEFRDERAYISLEHYENLKNHDVQAGDLILASLGEELPRVALVPDLEGPAIVKADVIRARLHPDVNSKWVLYALQAPATRAVAMSKIRGVGRPRLGLGEIRKLPIPLPPLAEQLRIVEVLEDHLSRLDAANRYIARVRQSTTSFDNTRRRELLDPWLSSTRKLKTLLASPLINGRSVPTDDDGFPVLRLTAIKNRVLDLSARKGGAWQREDATPFLVERGDFMVSRGNGSLRLVGRGALAVHDPDPVAFPDTMIRVRPNSDVVDPEFLAFVWDSQTVRRQIESAARTTAGIYKINQSILEALDIPIPPLDVQARIVEAALDHFAVVERLMEEAAMAQKRSKHLRRSLLVEAFTGSLARQDSADEPAIEILKRIEREHYSRPKSLRPRKSGPNKTTLPPPKITVVPTGTQEELAL
ncbi:restriction endonuclease subunit S [Nonomuraea sp. SMC257]|uniref:Restriction endonuclease subunit S n=1 Tax=Nonomuraea montanisoli TaxID=2741721 RepID=A0A7Y6M6P7_9ACTN|nr:restriction endonuclease subunit S [Nonomuraea montanisoli]NUW37128.1 restriction endonuclease subunit S [Nonomuraea montanisoli]